MATVKKTEKNPVLIIVLGLLTALGALATDIYLPAFKDIADKFGSTTSYVSLSLSSFFLGLSIGQLIYGPLLEKFGRKNPMFVGIVIYLIASTGCAMANSIDDLIIFRFFQALGACGGLVGARAMVKDLFKGKEVARVFSLLMVVLAISPILAPTLGGLITVHFSWRYVFYLLVILAILILLSTIFFLPETKASNKTYSLKFGSVFKNYREVAKNPYFAIFAIAGSISYSGVYAYLSGSPHLYLEMFEVSQTQYSIIFAIIATGLIGSSQVSNLLLNRFSSEFLIQRALVAQCGFAILLLVFHYVGWENVFITTVLMTGYMSCLGFIFPNASALAMSKLDHTAGNASALLGSIQMVIGAIASALVSFFQTETSISLIIVMMFCAFTAMTLLSRNSKKLSLENA